METIKTFEIEVVEKDLRGAVENPDLPDNLVSPLGALVSELTAQIKVSPVAVYLGSADKDAEMRNFFAYALARAMIAHEPTTVLVDCDFLSVGLSGIVPQRDGLGFLDLLLYGSSLGVITQTTASGVKTISAGSFPVSKRSPFVMDAFENARRYLLNHASCVILCGPALDDNDGVHPILENVDIPVVLRVGARARRLDPLEEKLSSVLESRFWSLRIVERERVAVSKARTTEPVAPKTASIDEALLKDVKPIPKWEEDGGGEVEPVEKRRRGNSIFAKVVTSLLGLALVAFLLYWLYLTRSARDGDPAAVTPPQTTQQTDRQSDQQPGAPADTTTLAAVGTVSTSAGTGDDTETSAASDDAAEEVSEPPAAQPRATEPVTIKKVEGSAPIALRANAEGVIVEKELKNYVGQYVVHVSSFELVENARKDADYLTGRGYDVFLYHVDLGRKGLWYRVYVGPFERREAAREQKIRLDENPRVRSTRIVKVRN